MAVWLDWGRSLLESSVDGGRVRVLTDLGLVELSFAGDVVGVEVGRDLEFNQSRVLARFKLPSDRGGFGFDVRLLDAESSWVSGVWAVSSSELEEMYGVGFIAVPGDSASAGRLRARLPEGEVLYLEDAFVRVVFLKAGHEWVEAPYRARVLWEGLEGVGNASARVTAYETEGLYINKTVFDLGSSLKVRYDVEAKEGCTLERLLLPVWLVWGRSVGGVYMDGGGIVVVTDAGALRVTPSGDGLKPCQDLGDCYGLDGEFHVPRIFFEYVLSPQRGAVSLTFESVNERSTVSARVDLTSRPVMDGGDKIWIANRFIGYTEVFSGDELSVFEVPRQLVLRPSFGVEG
jgi:hypothetical protein